MDKWLGTEFFHWKFGFSKTISSNFNSTPFINWDLITTVEQNPKISGLIYLEKIANFTFSYSRGQTDRVHLSNNGILYGGSLGRGGSVAAYSAFLRGVNSGRITFDPANQHFESKSFPAPASHQPGSITPTHESELAQETRLLRQHKTRLESRMQLLEDHNRALEDQLNRLRQYLNIPSTATPPPPRPTSSTPASLATSLNVQPRPVSHHYE